MPAVTTLAEFPFDLHEGAMNGDELNGAALNAGTPLNVGVRAPGRRVTVERQDRSIVVQKDRHK